MKDNESKSETNKMSYSDVYIISKIEEKLNKMRKDRIFPADKSGEKDDRHGSS